MDDPLRCQGCFWANNAPVRRNPEFWTLDSGCLHAEAWISRWKRESPARRGSGLLDVRRILTAADSARVGLVQGRAPECRRNLGGSTRAK